MSTKKYTVPMARRTNATRIVPVLLRVVAIFASVIAYILLLYNYSTFDVGDFLRFHFTSEIHDDSAKKNSMPCSEADIVQNAEFLSNHSTTCPSEPWYWEWQSILLGTNTAVTYIEVGCNKATDAVLNLKAFTGDTSVDIDEWTSTTKLANYACPFDRERWNKVSNSSSGTLYTDYTHFCIEAAAENAKPVQEAARQLGYDRLGLLVHHNAVSSSTDPSTIRFPVIPPGGGVIWNRH